LRGNSIHKKDAVQLQQENVYRKSRAEPIRTIGNPVNQHPDEWSSIVFWFTQLLVPKGEFPPSTGTITTVKVAALCELKVSHVVLLTSSSNPTHTAPHTAYQLLSLD
jgi:hypothetical protein